MKTIKRAIHSVIFVIVAFTAARVTADNEWSAKLKPLSDQLKGYGLPDYLIEVTFPTTNGFPIEEVRTLSHYRLSLRVNAEKKLVIKAAKPKGGIGGTGSEATHARQVELVPATQLDPSAEYMVEIVFGQ